MRKVTFKKWVQPQYLKNELTKRNEKVIGTGCFEPEYSNIGLFHTWASDYDECDENFGNFTVGIIELPDGTVTTVRPENIRFMDALNK